MEKFNVGNGLNMESGGWKFSKELVEEFDDHILRSVPRYLDCHKLAILASDFFLSDNSVVVDIGSTTGTFAEKLGQFHKTKNKLNIKCVEIENHFCNFATKRLEKSGLLSVHNIEVLNEDINLSEMDPESIDMFTSFFTLQFIKPKLRAKLLENIYKSLNWGGGLILFEKVRGSDARFQDILNHMLNMEKISTNFTPEEIFSKTISLAGKMEPFSDKGNRQILQKAGFVDIEIIFKHINIQGYLCIK